MKKIITFLSSFFLIISLNVNADDEASNPKKIVRDTYGAKVEQSMKDFTDITAWGKNIALTADAQIVAMVDGLTLSLLDVALNDDGTAKMEISSHESEVAIRRWNLYATQFTESENKIFETNFQEIVKQYNDSPKGFDIMDTNNQNASDGLNAKIELIVDALMLKTDFESSSQNVLAAKNFVAGFSSMLLAKSPACVPQYGGSCASPGM
jgi:hypothetical protein